MRWLPMVLLLASARAQLRQLNYTVVENEPAPVLIANLTADVLHSGLVHSLILNDSADNYLFAFSREQQPNMVQHFVVEDGLLLSRASLDRETLGTTIMVNLLFAIRRRSASVNERPFSLSSLRVVISLQDANDNAPVWTEYAEDNLVTVQFSEGALPAAVQVISGAIDSDSEANALVTYTKSCTTVTAAAGLNANGTKLCGNADPFYISAQPSSKGGEIAITLNCTLDRESVSEYSFEIVAKDDGRRRQSSTLLVRVLVADVNDHMPTFSRANYSVSLLENLAINQVFLRVHADDPDDAANGQVTYAIRSSSVPDCVAIDMFTGEMSLTKQLDYETAPVIEVRVQARDDHRPPKSSTVVVWINVLDVNDAAPLISVHDCGDTLTPSLDIEELREPFVTGCRITALDDDAGPAGEVHCEVTNGEGKYFDLELASASPPGRGDATPPLKANRNPLYFMRLKHKLDRETASRYDVRIQCSDHGSPPQSSSAQVLVRVLDVNDCQPRFVPVHVDASSSKTRWFTEARENSEVGTVVTRLTATDCDDSFNSELEFRILNQTLLHAPSVQLAQPPFAVREKTGELIVVTADLDRERHERYLLLLQVKDRGSPPLSSTVWLEVAVLDENDNPSVFTQRAYEFSVQENAVGIEIGQVRATDLDRGENANFKFFLEEATGDEREQHRYKFHLDENTGVLTNLMKLDRELQASYRFTVRVVDKFRKFNDSAPLVVRVADVNDNKPEFRFPSLSNYNVHVNYPLINGDNITRVLAVDPDAGENGTVHYSVTEYFQVAPRLFDIHSDTGTVYIKRDIELADLKGHKLVVRAHDGAKAPLANTASIYVYLDKGALPPTHLRVGADAGGLPYNQQSTTAHSYFNGVSDALLLTVCLCSVFVCVVVLASIVLLVLFRRFKQHRRTPRGNYAVKRNETTNKEGVTVEEAQRIFVAEKTGTLQRCTLSDPSRLLHSTGTGTGTGGCFNSMTQSTNEACCSAKTGCGAEPLSHQSSRSSASSYMHGVGDAEAVNDDVVRTASRSQKLASEKANVAVIEKALRERDSCTPVWKPRSLEKACVNPECVLCRSVSKSATMQMQMQMENSPKTKRQTAAATISRDYAVGYKVTDSQRMPRRKHVEIRSPFASPKPAGAHCADHEAETQNRHNDQRIELAEDKESSSCNLSLSLSSVSVSAKQTHSTNGTGTGTGTDACNPRSEGSTNSRGTSTDYATAISVHLTSSDEPHTAANQRCAALQSFNKCRSQDSASASYV